MSDVTIPAEDAKRLADVLRHRTTDPGREERLRWADLLDPQPAPSLRDEVAAAMSESWAERDGWEAAADAVLAVVRRHVEGLDRHSAASLRDVPFMDKHHKGQMLDRDDVLRLLGGSDE